MRTGGREGRNEGWEAGRGRAWREGESVKEEGRVGRG